MVFLIRPGFRAGSASGVGASAAWPGAGSPPGNGSYRDAVHPQVPTTYGYVTIGVNGDAGSGAGGSAQDGMALPARRYPRSGKAGSVSGCNAQRARGLDQDRQLRQRVLGGATDELARYISYELPGWAAWLVMFSPALISVVWYVLVWVTRDWMPMAFRVAAWVMFPLAMRFLIQYTAMHQPPIDSDAPLFGPTFVYLVMGFTLLLVAVPLTIVDILVCSVRRLRRSWPPATPAAPIGPAA